MYISMIITNVGNGKDNKVYALILFCISLFFSALNDSLMKILKDDGLSDVEVAFWRFFFGTVILACVMCTKRRTFKTRHLLIHFLRSFIFFLATMFWIKGLAVTGVIVATVISFCTPIFILFLSYIVLHEKITVLLCVASLINFLSILFAIVFNLNSGVEIGSGSIYLFLASFCFALSDLVTKKFEHLEKNDTTMVFYFNMFACLMSFAYSCLCGYRLPLENVYNHIVALFLLGCSANCLSYFLLKAYHYANASFLSDFKFLEFIFTMLFAHFLLNEHANFEHYVAMVVIIICNIIVFLKEGNKRIKRIKS